MSLDVLERERLKNGYCIKCGIHASAPGYAWCSQCSIQGMIDDAVEQENDIKSNA